MVHGVVVHGVVVHGVVDHGVVVHCVVVHVLWFTCCGSRVVVHCVVVHCIVVTLLWFAVLWLITVSWVNVPNPPQGACNGKLGTTAQNYSNNHRLPNLKIRGQLAYIENRKKKNV